VVRPLAGLRLAPYYGCQVVRPINNNDSPEYPMKMDRLLQWLGAEVVDYPVKAHCCGGHMTQISEPQAFELIRRLLQSAADYDADLIVCMCPMCQLNLDGYQARVNKHFNTNFKLPIMYFTQMLGVAFGIELKKLGFGKELVAAAPVLKAKMNGQLAAT
jgi:heterodisulfide reductase subunit B